MNITVYCGSAIGSDPAFREAAAALGAWMAQNGHTLVYGAGKVGMMGVIADAVIDNGGRVIGVTPGFFIDRDEIHAGLDRLEVVKNLSERRSLMLELGDAFIALPGGMGTLDEITEVCANNRLRQFAARDGDKDPCRRPAILYNVNGYYDTLKAHLDNMVDMDFYRQSDLDYLTIADSIEAIAERLK